MYKIFKYEIKISDISYVELPKDSKILKYGEQNCSIYLWAIVDTEKELVNKRFHILGTGTALPRSFIVNTNHCDTVFIGGFVWHIFEEKEV